MTREGSRQCRAVRPSCAPHPLRTHSFPHHHADPRLWVASSGEKGSMLPRGSRPTLQSHAAPLNARLPHPQRGRTRAEKPETRSLRPPKTTVRETPRTPPGGWHRCADPHEEPLPDPGRADPQQPAVRPAGPGREGGRHAQALQGPATSLPRAPPPHPTIMAAALVIITLWHDS